MLRKASNWRPQAPPLSRPLPPELQGGEENSIALRRPVSRVQPPPAVSGEVGRWCRPGGGLLGTCRSSRNPALPQPPPGFRGRCEPERAEGALLETRRTTSNPYFRTFVLSYFRTLVPPYLRTPSVPVAGAADPLALQPAFHKPADLRQPLRRARLVAGDQHGLGVAGADQAPSVAEEHARAVHVDHLVILAEVLDRAAHDGELGLLRGRVAQLGGGDELRELRQPLRERPAAAGDDVDQQHGAVQRVVEPVVVVAEHDVAGELARQQRVLLLHPLLDERVARRVHDRHAA